MNSILFINRISSSKDGATGRVLEELNKNLQEKSFKSDILSADKIKNRFLALIYLIYKSIFIPKNKYDCVIIMTDPPFLICLAPLFKLKNIKVIHWAQDIYPDLFRVFNYPILNLKIFNYLNMFFYKFVNYFILIGRDMSLLMQNEYNISADKIFMIPNWADTYLKPLNLEQEKLRILYSGNMGKAYDFDLFLQVANLLKEEENNICFFLQGNGKQKNYVLNKIKELNLSNVKYQDYVNKKDYLNTLNSSSINFIPIKKETNGLLVPSKAYSIFACGISCIYSGNQNSEIAQLIKYYDCGWNIETAENIAKKIKELYINRNEIKIKNENALKVSRDYDLDKASKKIEGIIQLCIADN